MPRLSPAIAAARRDAILDATDRVIARHGFADLSISAIVEELHGSTGAIYAHFSDKAALHSALVRRALRRRNLRVATRVRQDQHIAAAVEAVVDIENGATSLAVVVGTWATAATDPLVRAVLNDADTALRDLVTTVLAPHPGGAPAPAGEAAGELVLSTARSELLHRALTG